MLRAPVTFFANGVRRPQLIDVGDLSVEAGLRLALFEEVSSLRRVQSLVAEKGTDGGESLARIHLSVVVVESDREPLVLVFDEDETGSLRNLDEGTLAATSPPWRFLHVDLLDLTDGASSLLFDLDSLALVGLDVSSDPELSNLVVPEAFSLEDVAVGSCKATLDASLSILLGQSLQDPATESAVSRHLALEHLVTVRLVLVLRENELSARDEEAAQVLITRSNGIRVLGESGHALLLSCGDGSSRLLGLSAFASLELHLAGDAILVDRE